MEAYFDEWSDLEAYLNDLVTRLQAEAYRLFDARNIQLLPYVDNIHTWERMEEATRAFRRSFGDTFVVQGSDRLQVQSDDGNRFLVQSLLSTYTLLITLPVDMDVEASGCLFILERAKPGLCELLRRLPPPDGGLLRGLTPFDAQTTLIAELILEERPSPPRLHQRVRCARPAGGRQSQRAWPL